MSRIGLLVAVWMLVLTQIWAQESEPAAIAPEEIDIEVGVQKIDVAGITQDLRVVSFEALSIGRETKYMIILPDGYDESEDRYPVIYLLHGFSQNYTVWPMMGVANYLDTYDDMIIVMPDVGNSWYINWAESDGDELNNWEDFIIYDLVHNVDQSFRTYAGREGRAISGLSMGGYGAMVLGLRHPEMFCSIASHSGALGYARNAREALESGAEPMRSVAPAPDDNPKDSNVPEFIAISGFTRQHERYPNGAAFLTVDDCNQYDPFFLIQKIPQKLLPHIYLDCGLDDGLLNVSQEFAMQMMQQSLPFTYGQSPGEHRPSYWGREVAQSLGVQYSVIKRNVQFMLQKEAQESQQELEPATGAAPQDTAGHEGHDHSSDKVRQVIIE